MATLYSLNELKEMKNETRRTIADICKSETQSKGFMSAKDLAAATGGLCSKYHIASSCTGIGRNSYNTDDTPTGYVPVDVLRAVETHSKYYLECDSSGAIIPNGIIHEVRHTTKHNVYSFK